MRISTTIPDVMYKTIKENYKRIGYTSVNDFILDCIRRSELYLSSPMNQIGVEIRKVNPWSDNPVDDRPVLQHTKVEKIIKKVKKSESCPHLIMVGGICNPCGGIAK